MTSIKNIISVVRSDRFGALVRFEPTTPVIIQPLARQFAVAAVTVKSRCIIWYKIDKVGKKQTKAKWRQHGGERMSPPHSLVTWPLTYRFPVSYQTLLHTRYVCTTITLLTSSSIKQFKVTVVLVKIVLVSAVVYFMSSRRFVYESSVTRS